MNTRKSLSAFALVIGLLAIGRPAPAFAQTMPELGFDIPWFHSTTERHAREACEQNLPECRASVRQELAKEHAASLVTPWLILGVGILLALVWLRRQEQKKVKQRQRAQRRHDPKAFRKLDKTPEDRAEESASDTL